ncbi:MAG TPA: ssl1498 family light-harvesting-like protein [Trichormus sp. M33_DOE_039]|nr:ssl1498 family light-harvesting-like protein [Trichormus sp. M33_DOE_039]
MYFNQEGELKAGKKSHKEVAPLRSDGSELIPAEVQARRHKDGDQLLNLAVAPGYTVDDEGIINSYAIQPVMSLAEYPSPEQQQRYIFQGAIAILFVALTLMTAIAVS